MKTDEELLEGKNALNILHSEIERIKKFKLIDNTLPENVMERTILFIRKKELTDMKYPRRAGKPTKKPL